MMTRGSSVIVVDENLFQLVPALKAFNVHVITPTPGMSDKDIADKLLPNRIFITRNSPDFFMYAGPLSIGIISLEGLKFIDNELGTKNSTVKVISLAIIKYKLWSRKNGFYLELKEDGKHKFQTF